MLYIVVPFVVNCRDAFFPVPFPLSPFGFHRFKRPIRLQCIASQNEFLKKICSVCLYSYEFRNNSCPAYIGVALAREQSQSGIRQSDMNYEFLGGICPNNLVSKLKKREGVPEMGTKPLKALRGYRASNRGSNRGSRGSNRGSKGSRKTPEALRG